MIDMSIKRKSYKRGLLLILAVILACLFLTSNNSSFALNEIPVEQWLGTTDEPDVVASGNKARCYATPEDMKNLVTIFDYKAEMARLQKKPDGTSYKYLEKEGEDYILDSSGNKLYAWKVSNCVIGYDLPVSQRAAVGNNSVTLFGLNGKKLNEDNGVLLYLHRIPYEMTVFQNSRYDWYYSNDTAYSYIEDGVEYNVPSLEGVPANNSSYSQMMTTIINNNSTFYGTKFTLGYTPVPHVLGSEGTPGFSNGSTNTYKENGVEYMAVALMDETNGQPVPVLINISENETPFWSFHGKNLPENQTNYIAVKQPSFFDNNYWMFQIAHKDGTGILQPFVKLSDIVESDKVAKGGIAVADAQLVHVAKNEDDMYDAREYMFALPSGPSTPLGHGDGLDTAIKEMKYPFLVSNIQLAMDETITQRNSSVQFMTGMYSNYAFGYTPSDVDYGQAYTGYGPARTIIPNFTSEETLEKFFKQSNVYNTKNILMTVVADGNNFNTGLVSYKVKNPKKDNGTDKYNTYNFKTTGLTVIGGLGQKWTGASTSADDLHYIRMPFKVFSRTIVTEPYTRNIEGYGPVQGFTNSYRESSEIPGIQPYTYGFHSFYSLGRYVNNYEKSVMDMTRAIEFDGGYNHGVVSLWSWDKNDDFGTWRYVGITPSGYGYFAAFPYDTTDYSPYRSVEGGVLSNQYLYPWRGNSTGKLVSNYIYNKIFLEVFYDKQNPGSFDRDNARCVLKNDLCKNDTSLIDRNYIYQAMLDNFSDRMLTNPQTILTLYNLAYRVDKFDDSYLDNGPDIYTGDDCNGAGCSPYPSFMPRHYAVNADLYNQFEKNYCKALTMKLEGDGQNISGSGRDPVLGNYTYNPGCDGNWPISTGNIPFNGDGFYKDSYSALVNTWGKLATPFYPEETGITYKEALAYLFFQFYAVDQLSSDLVIGRLTGYRDANNGTDRNRYINLSITHGEFANVYLLNEETRLAERLLTSKTNGASSYFSNAMLNTTLKVAGYDENGNPKGEDVTVNKYPNDKDYEDVETGAFPNKFGPELFLINSSTGQYASEKEVQIKCPDGYNMQGSKCIKTNEMEAVARCRDNLKYNQTSGFCEIITINAASCPGGYNLINGNCVRLAGTSAVCNDTEVYDETLGMCVSKRNGVCPNGWSRDAKNDECVKTVDKGCPYGGEILDGKCVSETDKFTGTFPEDAIKDFSYTGNVQSITLTPGTYKLEAWGAQGGGKAYAGAALNNSVGGGKGGYSSGILNVTSNTTVYVYVGGQGVEGTGAAFNGGGSAKALPEDNIASIGGGGGASDIRIGSNGNDYRVLVAGGGGGTLSFDNKTFFGGVGGGEVGGTPDTSYDYPFMAGNEGQPGTDSYGGVNTAYAIMNGSYANGGSANANASGAGGGGGWYGGAAGLAGAGGSGFVYDGIYPTPNTYKLDTKYKLKEAYTVPGDSDFLNPDGITSTGNSGNGYVRITKTDTANNAKYVCDHVKKDLLPGESVELRGAYIGQAYDFDYTGSCSTWVAPVTGTYYMEGWGASGGHSAAILDGGQGGKGGYTAGYVTLNQGEEVQICVGGAGQQGTNSTSVKAAGGFNGGGSSTALGGGGGGMTSIRTIDKNSGLKKHQTWNFPGTTNGWGNGYNVQASYDYTERAMKYHISNIHDPQLNSPVFSHKNASNSDYVNITLKTQAQANIQVYFSGTSGGYSETNVLRRNNIPATGDAYTTISIPATSVGWTGTITQLRLDIDHPVGDIFIKEVSISNKPVGDYILVAGGGGGGGIGAEYSEEIVDNSYKSKMLDDMSSQGNGTDYNSAVVQYATVGQKIQFKMGKYSNSATATMRYYIVYSTNSPTLGKNWASNLAALEQLKTGTYTMSSIPKSWSSNFNNLVEITTMTVPKTGYYTIYTNESGARTSSRSTYDVVLGTAVWTVLIHTDDSGIGGVGGGVNGGNSLKGVNVDISGFGGTAAKHNAIGVGGNSSFGGAGGGGYYGGNGATFEGGGGGGSGYIGDDMTGANTWDGNSWFKSPTANYSQSVLSHEQGHEGNGYARITLTSAKTMDGKSTWTARSKGQHLNSAGSASSFSGRAFYPDRTKTFNYCQIINPQNDVWITESGVVNGSTNNNTNIGVVDEYTNGKLFTYTGRVQPVTLQPGVYELEAWGASGGNGLYDTYRTNAGVALGGAGGYSKGTITLDEITTIYVYVGGQGVSANNASITSSGGFNGGGTSYGHNNQYYYAGGGGGGASDIRIGADSLYARVLVAGGGGGGSVKGTNYKANFTGQGGAGGGLSGIAGTIGEPAGGVPGTATSGYQFGIGKNTENSGCMNGGGGGGGWFGGYSGNKGNCVYGSAGAGGSGYAYSAATATNTASSIIGGTWLLNNKYYLSNTSTLDGTKSIPSVTGTGTTIGNVGNGAVKIKRVSDGGTGNTVPGTPTTYTYTGKVQAVTLVPGTYKLEAWGAQGGGSYSNGNFKAGAGLGGYSTGAITLTETTTLYLYVGGKGEDGHKGTTNPSIGGFNGGGTASGDDSDMDDNGGGGGGASDIRIGTDSLYARVLVAGGGGGNGFDSGYTGYSGVSTGVGGGVNGGIGIANGNNKTSQATQTSGNSFGVGAPGSKIGGGIAGGGGGGWFGGYGGVAGGCGGPGSGGSGFVYTASSNTASSIIGGTWLLNNKYYLSDASTVAGNATMPKYNGSGNMTGNSGNGAVRITPLSIAPSVEVGGESKAFSYTGKVQTVTLNPGSYTLEAWGAAGGDVTYSPYKWLGGYGAYATGTLDLKNTTTLYLYVGGRGGNRTTANAVNGGFNGGGNSPASTTSSYTLSAGGGGASDIRIGSDSLFSRVLVAAGGGGAGYGTQASSTANPEIGGGMAGADNGYLGTYYNSYDARRGLGGTLTSGGLGGTKGTTKSGFAGSFGAGGNGVTGAAAGAGGGGGWFGGGGGANGAQCAGAGGGGSSFAYCANTAQHTASSIIGGTWLLNNSYYLTNARTVAGNATMPNPTDPTKTMIGNSGNGVIKITGNMGDRKPRPEIYDARIRYDKMCSVGYAEVGDKCEARKDITCNSGYKWDILEKKCIKNNKPVGCTNAGTVINIGGSGSSTRWACGYTSSMKCEDGFHLKGSSCVADVIPQEIPEWCIRGYTYDAINKKCVHTDEIELDTSSLTDDILQSKPLTGDKMVVEVGQVYAFRNYIGYNASTSRAAMNQNGSLTSSVFFPQVVTNMWLFKNELATTGCERNGKPAAECEIKPEDAAIQIPITLTPKKIVSGNKPNLEMANKYNADVAQYLNRNPGTMLSTYPRQNEEEAPDKNNTYLASHLFAYYEDNNQGYGNKMYDRYALVEFVFKIEHDAIYILNRNSEGKLETSFDIAVEIDWKDATVIPMEDVYQSAKAAGIENVDSFFKVDGTTGKHTLNTVNEKGESLIKSIVMTSTIDAFSPIDVTNIAALNAIRGTGHENIADDKALAMMIENSDTSDDTSAWVGGFKDAVGDVYIDRLEIVNEKGEILRRYDAMTDNRCTNPKVNGYTMAFKDKTYAELDAGVTPVACEEKMNVPQGIIPSITLSRQENYQVRIYTKYVNEKDDKFDPKVNQHNLKIQQVVDGGAIDITKFLTGIHDDQGFMSIWSGKVDRTNIIAKQFATFSYDMGWVPGKPTAFTVNFNLADMNAAYFSDMLLPANKEFAENATPLIIPLKALVEGGEAVREGIYSADIGDGSKAINTKKDWDSVKFGYATGDIPDNSVDVFFECLNKDTNQWDRLEFQTGMCKRLDVKVYNTKCRTYAIVKREKLSNYDTDTKLGWAATNIVSADMDGLPRGNAEGPHIKNVGDFEKIFLEEFSSDLENSGQYRSAKIWLDLVDANTSNNTDFDCLNWGEKVNYSVTDLTTKVVNPDGSETARELLLRDTKSSNRTIYLEGTYYVNKIYENQLQRDVNITFKADKGTSNALTCATTSEACNVDGIQMGAYTKTTMTAQSIEEPVNQQLCYRIKCTVNENKLAANDHIKVTVAINGGNAGTHAFQESNYTDNESYSDITVSDKVDNIIAKCDEKCTEKNNWDLLFDFVYNYESKIVPYNTTQGTYMTWSDNAVGGTNADNGRKLTYSSAINGANATTAGQGNELRSPIDYLAFKTDTLSYQPLCTDYRSNNSQCWRYEMNATHNITYYTAHNALTDVYTTQMTLPNTVDAGNCTNQRRTDFGSNTAATGQMGGQSGDTNNYATVTGGDRLKDSCHGYNQGSVTGNGSGSYCQPITDWWGNQICDIGANVEQFTEAAQGGKYPSDYIPYSYFGTADGGHSLTASDTLGNTAIGYASWCDSNNPGKCEGDKSQTTKSQVIVLKNQFTQGSKNTGWVQERTQDVCTVHTWMDIGYSCPANYLYGTHYNDRYYKETSENTYGICYTANNRDDTRICEWTNNSVSPPETIWWNDSGATCYREHSDFACHTYHGVAPDQSQINNSGNTSSATCRWSVVVSPTIVQHWYPERKVTTDSAKSTCRKCNCDDYGNNCDTCCTSPTASCSASVTCDDDSDSCTASDGGSCSVTCIASASYVNYTLTWTHSGWQTVRQSFSKKCDTTEPNKTFTRTQSASTNYNGTTVDSPGGGGASTVTDSGVYVSQNCNHPTDKKYSPDNYCYETHNDKTGFGREVKQNEVCTRWKKVPYKEIKYLTTRGGTKAFVSREYSNYQNNLYQYTCDSNQPVAYPDTYVVKRYTETFKSQLFIATDRSGWAWIPGEKLTSDLLPRTGEEFGVKVESQYSTTRGTKPNVESHIQSFYDNYHNITTGPNKNTISVPSYDHFNYNNNTYHDMISNTNYGYCSANVSEPYGCEMSSNTGFTWDIRDGRRTVNGVLQFTHTADTQPNAGMTDHTYKQGNMANNWLSYMSTTAGKCYFGPDDPLRWGEPETTRLNNQNVTLHGTMFGTENQYSSQLYITKKSAEDGSEKVLNIIPLKGTGKCLATVGKLCTNYFVLWEPPVTTSVAGNQTNKIYIDVHGSYEDITVEFRHSPFYGVGKYEQLLLGASGGGQVWGNDVNGNFTQNGKYFNKVDNKEILPMCSCDSITFSPKGEVGWGTTEWEVD